MRLQKLMLVQAAVATLHAVPMTLGPCPALLLQNALRSHLLALWQLLARLVWQLCDAQQCLKMHRARLPALQLLDLCAVELLLLLRHLAVQLWAARQRLKRHCCHLPARRLLREQEVGVWRLAIQEACLRCRHVVCLKEHPVLLGLVLPCWACLPVCHCSALPALGCPCCCWQAQRWCRAELAADPACQ